MPAELLIPEKTTNNVILLCILLSSTRMMSAPQPLNPGGEGANQNLQLKWLLVPSAGKCETVAKRGKTYTKRGKIPVNQDMITCLGPID